MGRKKAEISGTKNERLPIKTAGNKGNCCTTPFF